MPADLEVFRPQQFTFGMEAMDAQHRALRMRAGTTLISFAALLLPQFEVSDPDPSVLPPAVVRTLLGERSQSWEVSFTPGLRSCLIGAPWLSFGGLFSMVCPRCTAPTPPPAVQGPL